ncbi:MAG: glycoside hydrolase, partial [Acidobacteriaceae bacterium]|nr:glycoside hydrolase [Acidobacteriaceae bacterium]
TPATAMRIRGNQNKDTPLPPETPAGQNPPDGAVLYYSLNATARMATLEILDATGSVIRKYSSDDPKRPRDNQATFPDYWLRPPAPLSTDPGLHRWVWDLRYPSPVATRQYSMAASFGEDTPMLPQGPMVVPGKYEVRLTVDGKAVTQPLTVVMDPRVKTSTADLVKQFDFGMRIWDALQKEQDQRRRMALAHLAGVVDSGDRAPTSQAVAEFEELMRPK